jgi:hypothetical protein
MLKNIEEYYLLGCGRYLCFLDHPLERYLDRVRVEDSIRVKKEVERIANDLAIRIIHQSNDEPGYYGVHSNSTGIGFVIDWRKDNTYPPVNDLNHAWMMTFFPIKKYHHFKSEDTVYIVSQILYDAIKRGSNNKALFINANTDIKRFVRDRLPHRLSSESRYMCKQSYFDNSELVISFQGKEMIENSLIDFFLID